MQGVLYIVLDFLEYLLRGCLLVYLLKGCVLPKNKRSKLVKKLTSGIVVVQFAFIRMLWNNLPVLKRVLYGEKTMHISSKASIVVIIFSMSITILIGFWLYDGSKSTILYLVFTDYTLSELTRFTLHSFFMLLMNGLIGIFNHMVRIGNGFVIRHFNECINLIQLVWNILFSTVFLSLLYFILKQLKKQFLMGERKLKIAEMAFLAVPSIIGFCFIILLRSIMYSMKGDEVHFLMEDNPETYLLIPLIAALCICSIILCAKILKSLVKQSEKEVILGTYKNRISDMEEHMKDVEHLYDGIRGVKHDMKNYVADLEALLKGQNASQPMYEEEVKMYLDGLCATMEQLDMQCNTGNPVTDVVISRKIREAINNKITFTCDFIYPKALQISAFDLSIILNNSLDNAMEAAKKVEKDAFIKVSSYRKGNMFFLEVKNSFDGNLIYDDSKKALLTIKEDTLQHGFGLKNIENCVEKYYGSAEYHEIGNEFILTVMLQGIEEN